MHLGYLEFLHRNSTSLHLIHLHPKFLFGHNQPLVASNTRDI
jgi:hypothetical protein